MKLGDLADDSDVSGVEVGSDGDVAFAGAQVEPELGRGFGRRFLHFYFFLAHYYK